MKKGMFWKSFAVLVVVILTIILGASVALAAPGGQPAAHGVDGKTFGGLVSDLAQDYPGAAADHVSQSEMGGGIPAAHGVDGKTLGGLVSDLAKSGPGAIADHIHGE